MKSVENSIFSPRTTNTKQSSRPKSGPIRQLSLVERAAWCRLREKFFNFVTAYQRPARRARPRGFIYAIFPERIFKPLRAINSSRLFIYGRVAVACKQIQQQNEEESFAERFEGLLGLCSKQEGLNWCSGEGDFTLSPKSGWCQCSPGFCTMNVNRWSVPCSGRFRNAHEMHRRNGGKKQKKNYQPISRVYGSAHISV